VEISFIRLDVQTVEDCSMNMLIITDFTEAETERGVLADYTIAASGSTPAPMTIPAKIVKSTVGDICPTTTHVEFMDASGNWVEQRSNA
jgi:hypothetical protein